MFFKIGVLKIFATFTGKLETDLGLVKLVVMTKVFFNIAINTKLKLNGSFALIWFLQQ